ncbi:MAG: aminotransferase class V-fold PLP-dependent enzyme [Acidimicrobiia bacterium]|nr:aminotransferase class V-fold PLP-dependent enzyme [Acidimicrobiia bacterium]
MDLERAQRILERLPPRWGGWLYRRARRHPGVARHLDDRYAQLLAGLAGDLKPPGEPPVTARLPETGLDQAEVLARIAAARSPEEEHVLRGYASGAVYHGDPTHVDFLNQAYGLQSQSNPLHADLWPSTVRFEAEIVRMTAGMLNGAEAVGTVTSGGTESILLAMKAYRDQARAERGIKRPEMVIPTTAHAAFLKAAEYFQIKPRLIPVDHTFRADPAAAAAAITRNTIVVAGSAPSFAHGTIDPITELAEIARHRRAGMHVDACLGGFLLPWVERLGYEVPPFDFRVPGVTSMSADTHKYGYAAKGTSVVLYRDAELRRHQYFTAADWPGGLYASPTLAGSRPGGLSTACWAAMMSMGEAGYLDAASRIMGAAGAIRTGIAALPGLRVLGDPLWVISFTSDEIDIYRVNEEMTRRGWSLNGLQHPPAVHLAVTLRHAEPGVVGRFLDDLAAAVEAARRAGDDPERGTPLYGMATSFPIRAAIDDVLERYLDLLYDLPRAGE